MKYIRYSYQSRTGWGVLDGETVRPLEKAPWLGLSRCGDVIPLHGARLLAPVAPSKIVAVGHNYQDHAEEMREDMPDEPVLFLKPLTSLNNPEGTVNYPKLSKRVDYEGELAFVVGRVARCVRAEEANDYIFGYTCLNDVTARDLQKKDGQWVRAKGFDGFAPVGPWLVTDVDVSQVSIVTRVNGVVKQSDNTSRMVWSVPELLAFISSCMTLMPGDLVTTGTPAGIGPLEPGDTVEVEIENIGVLRNYVMEETGGR